MADQIFEGFSITHAQVLDGSTTFENVTTGSTAWGDVYGVDQASLDVDQDQFDNPGDDVVKSTWYWLNFANVNIRAGYFSMTLIATLLGSTAGGLITSSGAGSTQLFRQDLWHQDSMNIGRKPLLLRALSKDKSGTVRTLDFGLYSVQFAPVSFDGPAYKDGLKVNYNGRALFSSTDEVGATFSDGKQRIGAIISRGLV